VLEVVQRRFTRLIPGMGGLCDEERSDRLDLYPMEFRRVNGDLIETFAILRIFLDRVDVERMLPPVEGSRTGGGGGGHCLKIRGSPIEDGDGEKCFLSEGGEFPELSLRRRGKQSLGIFLRQKWIESG